MNIPSKPTMDKNNTAKIYLSKKEKVRRSFFLMIDKQYWLFVWWVDVLRIRQIHD